MSAENPENQTDVRLEALQAAYDRVHSYSDGASVQQVRAQLDGALDEAGADVDDQTRDRLAEHIHEGRAREDIGQLLA